MSNSDLISRSVLGGAIASVVGGSIWGLQLIFSNTIFIVLLFGLGFICYAIVRLATLRSRRNRIVVMASAIAFALSLGIGHLLYEIFGFRG